jgi:hypothetical protein
MAAGLPAVVSDWDGYRDTVRHGMDGFLIPTLMPSAHGEDIAYRYESTMDNYGSYLGITSQCVSVDTAACVEAFSTLATNPDLRRTMGEAGRRRALDTFDWSILIRSYQDLWADLAERRRTGSVRDPRSKDQAANPLRPDPFKLFATYPTQLIDLDDYVELRPGADGNRVKQLRSQRLTGLGAGLLSSEGEISAALAHLKRAGPCRVSALLKQLPRARRDLMYRTLGWMAKTDLVAISRGEASPPLLEGADAIDSAAADETEPTESR